MAKNKKLVRLLLPSWVVNVVAISLAILVPALVIVFTRYQSSDLKLQVSNAHTQTGSHATNALYHTAANNLASNRFIGAAPLFIVWACVGLGVYYLTISLIKALGEVAELRQELEYVHVSRHALVREALLHFAGRAAATVGWFLFVKLTVAVLFPYALATASIAALSFSVHSVVYALLAAVVIYLTACGHAVFLRILFLRTRLLT